MSGLALVVGLAAAVTALSRLVGLGLGSLLDRSEGGRFALETLPTLFLASYLAFSLTSHPRPLPAAAIAFAVVAIWRRPLIGIALGLLVAQWIPH